tara:strand:+ start:7036 stop:7323 length:288 start_codon:yes stop_codon:yes gene_type:complete
MKEPKNTRSKILEINGISINVKAVEDDSDSNPSGWSIICFAPSASIRCIRAHQKKHLDLFIRGILALTGETGFSGSPNYNWVERTIHQVTDRTFE